MKQYDIKPGMILRLKKDRQEAYGSDSPFVTVTGLKARPGYKVGFVQSGTDYYTPQDFARFEEWA